MPLQAADGSRSIPTDQQLGSAPQSLHAWVHYRFAQHPRESLSRLFPEPARPPWAVTDRTSSDMNLRSRGVRTTSLVAKQITCNSSTTAITATATTTNRHMSARVRPRVKVVPYKHRTDSRHLPTCIQGTDWPKQAYIIETYAKRLVEMCMVPFAGPLHWS